MSGRKPLERGTLPSFLLALFIHVLLGLWLYYAVHWQSRTPVGVEAELWDAIPENPPQTVVETKPVVPQPERKLERKLEPELKSEDRPDIALQAEKRRAAAKATKALEATRAAEAAKAFEAAAQAQQREQNLRDAERQAAAATAAATASASGAGSRPGDGAGTGGTTSPGYADKVRRRVTPNILFDGDLPDNPTAVVAVHLAPDGTVLEARLARSSGHTGWDNAVLRAVARSNPLPRDENGVAPAHINLYFQPRE